MQGVSADVEAFHQDEEEGGSVRTQKAFWPGVPARCPVAACGSTEYKEFNGFLRHWRNKHLQSIKMFSCAGCKYKSARKYNVTKHIREKKHQSNM